MRRSAVAVTAIGVAVAGWALTPVIDLVWRGTTEQKTIRAWQEEARQRGRRESVDEAEDMNIPDQRGIAERSEERTDLGDPASAGTVGTRRRRM